MNFCTTKTIAALVVTAAFSVSATAQVMFNDDFEDRVQDQPTVGNNWTWYDQDYSGDECVGDGSGGFGPYDDGNADDYEADNRNYWVADVANGGDGNYYRAGLEVPAWDGAFTNMLRVFGNVYREGRETCQRTLIFQEMDIERADTYVFSYDVVTDKTGAPANGEYLAGFVKVLKTSDASYETVLFEIVDSAPVAGSIARRTIEFTLPEEYVGELLQFGFFNDLTPNLGQSWQTSAALYDNVVLEIMNIGPAHSGSWYDPDQSGHGFSIEFGELEDGSGFAVVYWYSYDDMGNPLFYVGIGEPVGQTLEVTFEAPTGMQYGVWDPDTVVREDGGIGVFDFSDRDNATFSYTPSDYAASTLGHTAGIEDLGLVKLFGIPANSNFAMPALP